MYYSLYAPYKLLYLEYQSWNFVALNNFQALEDSNFCTRLVWYWMINFLKMKNNTGQSNREIANEPKTIELLSFWNTRQNPDKKFKSSK